MKKILAMLMMCVMSFSLAGCGTTASNEGSEVSTDVQAEDTAAASSDEEFVIGITQWPGSYVWYGTQELGYFEKQGVNATVKMFDNYSDGMNALTAGNIDAYVLSYSDAMSPYINGADFKIVMIEDYSAGSDGLVVKPEITSVEELKGKTVATEIGTVDHMFLNKCLEAAGMSESDVQLTNMSIGDAGNAFIAGQVDAAVIWDPSLSMAVDAGGVVLSSTKDYPGLIPAVMAVNGDVLESRRDDVKKVMRAWFDSLDGYESNHEEFVGAVAEGAEISVEDFEMLMEGVDLISLDDNLPAFEVSDDYVSLVTCGMEHCEFLKSVDMISEIPDSIDDLIDGSLISEIAQEAK